VKLKPGKIVNVYSPNMFGVTVLEGTAKLLYRYCCSDSMRREYWRVEFVTGSNAGKVTQRFVD
jgi:hypothetical protein